MSGPYREGPSLLLCPRCGEILDRAFDDVLACLRCKGIFITPPTAGLAFDDPAWPKATSAMWWKSSLSCPVCASAGAETIMSAQTFEGTQIDRCATHGLWLDDGELSRLTRTTGDELAYLRGRLHGDGLDGSILDAKREEWRRDFETRRKAAEALGERIAAERAAQIEEADRRHAAETKAAEEQRRIAAAWSSARAPSTALFDTPKPKLESPKDEPKLTWREMQEQEQTERVAREQREQTRASAIRSIGDLEIKLMEARRLVRDLEDKLSDERLRLRALLDEA